MKAFWEFLLSSLQDLLGPQLGQLVAVIFCILVVLAVAAPLLMIMRAATNLRVRRDDGLPQTPGGDNLNPVILPQADPDPVALQASAQPVIMPQSVGRELDPRNAISPALPNIGRGGLAPFRYLFIAIAGITVAGAFFSRLANPANGLALVPVMLFAVAIAVVARMAKLRQSMGSASSIEIKRRVVMKDPIIIKLDKDALQRVRDRVSAGEDLDAVCTEIEPAYADWGAIRKEAFRKMMEMVLQQQQSATTATTTAQITF